MSANQYDLKSIMDNNNLSKADDETSSILSCNSSVMHLDENDAARLVTLESEIRAAKLAYEKLKIQAELDAKANEETKRLAEFYKRVSEEQALALKQRDEQLQAVKAAADAKANAEREAREAAERLAAQQAAAAVRAAQAATAAQYVKPAIILPIKKPGRYDHRPG